MITKLHSLSLFTHEITKMPGERQGILNVSFRFDVVTSCFLYFKIYSMIFYTNTSKNATNRATEAWGEGIGVKIRGRAVGAAVMRESARGVQ